MFDDVTADTFRPYQGRKLLLRHPRLPDVHVTLDKVEEKPDAKIPDDVELDVDMPRLERTPFSLIMHTNDHVVAEGAGFIITDEDGEMLAETVFVVQIGSPQAETTALAGAERDHSKPTIDPPAERLQVTFA